MGEGLEQLNQTQRENAEARFLDCCGSQRWARMMTEARPFADVAALLGQAEQIWQNLEAQTASKHSPLILKLAHAKPLQSSRCNLPNGRTANSQARAPQPLWCWTH